MIILPEEKTNSTLVKTNKNNKKTKTKMQKVKNPKFPLKLRWKLLLLHHQQQIQHFSLPTLETPKMSSTQPPSSSPSSKKQTLFITSLVVLWYSSNIGVLLLNKYLLSNYGFKFPIFLTMCHMSACAFLSYISIVFMKLVPLQPIKSRPQLLKIATLSVVFCCSVVGGNISLRYLPVSFNQAVGATTPFFTALFAYLMTFKREAWVTYGALVPVVAGVVIASGVCFSFCFFGSFDDKRKKVFIFMLG